MSQTTYVTESDIPFNEAFLMTDRFVILNMLNKGIWYVDKEHSHWPEIKETALNIARTFGDKETIEKLT
tara:strand:+ start:916 stop:1122 length:207 start_codon:yes stop_codon:yes gene_type:complete